MQTMQMHAGVILKICLDMKKNSGILAYRRQGQMIRMSKKVRHFRSLYACSQSREIIARMYQDEEEKSEIGVEYFRYHGFDIRCCMQILK